MCTYGTERGMRRAKSISNKDGTVLSTFGRKIEKLDERAATAVFRFGVIM